jgi:hypothetical protein
MSEPLSSTEIEDVLSSIRRLVSDDIRPAVRAQAAVAPVAGDKLILTPALRVVDTPVEASAPPMFVAVPRVQHNAENSTDFVQVVASVGAAVDAAHDDWDAEAGDALVSERDFAAAWAAGPAAAEAEFDSSAANEDEAVQVISAESDHFEYQEILVEPAAVAVPAEDVPAWAQEDGVGEVLQEEDSAVHNGMIEPDPVWADAAAASVIAGLADPVAASDDEDEDDDFAGEMRFNEDVLRELVRDILREELAGKMGERIIRKLVRTEISRAMMTQDIE